MKAYKILLLVSIFIFSLPVNAAQKNILILATGGTISGAGDSATGSKYSSSKLTIDRIIKNTPGLANLANIEAEQFIQIGSQDMDNATWLKIAKKVNEVLAQRKIDGIVITHGTDTLEETAYFLNLVAKSKKPVVIVGAMRPSTSLSADGALNLYNAVALAASDAAIGKGVLVLMNDEVFAARDVTKSSTNNVASFKANNSGPIGYVHYGKPQIYYEPLRRHSFNSEFNVKKLSELPKVDIIYSYVDQDGSVVDSLIAAGTKAIIVAGVGDGNVSKVVLQKLSDASKKGILIVRSARVGNGFTVPNVEFSDDELGFVTADNLSPQKARILAMMALTKTNDLAEIKRFFAAY